VDYKRGPTGDATVAEQWVRGGDDLFQADMVSGDGGTTALHGVSIYDRAGNRLLRVIRAASAVPVAGGWMLTQARSFDVARGTETTSATLPFPSDVTAQQFTTVSVNPSHVPFWNLIDEIGEQRAAGRNVDALVASANHKISGPLSAMLMPLLGAVAAFGLARSGRLFVRAVIGMFLGFAFFVADNFMSAMGNFGTVPPVLAAWAPFILFFLIGETVLFRTEE
jgi:lipopolysaccharide export system permease protein